MTVMVWLVFIGGLTLYMKHRGAGNDFEENFHEFNQLKKQYALEITPSFILQTDPFALNLESRDTPPAMLVRLGQQEILTVNDPSNFPQTFKIEPLHGLSVGKNELYIEASPPLDHNSTQNALRIRITENGYALAEETFWSPPGAKVSGTFQFTLTPDDHNLLQENHGHP